MGKCISKQANNPIEAIQVHEIEDDVKKENNNNDIKAEEDDVKKENNNNNNNNNNIKAEDNVKKENNNNNNDIKAEDDVKKENNNNNNDIKAEEDDVKKENNNNNNDIKAEDNVKKENNNNNNDIHKLSDSVFLQKYTLIRKLGQGNFAEVWLSEEKDNKNNVFAVKIFEKKNITEKELNHIKREIHLWKSVSNHPNICSVHDSYEDSKNIYLLMDYCSGGNLLDVCLKGGSRTEKETALIVRDIAGALEHLHTVGIVHRDVKLENILLYIDEKAKIRSFKLADFGLAKAIKLVDKNTNEQYKRLLKSACGSPLYVAPEIVNRRPYGAAVDCWSLGVVVYSLLSGMNPFYRDGTTNKQLYKRIRMGHFLFRQTRWQNISRDTKKFICYLLETNPKRRYTAKMINTSEWLIAFCKTELSPVLAATAEPSAASISKIDTIHQCNVTNVHSDDNIQQNNNETKLNSDNNTNNNNSGDNTNNNNSDNRGHIRRTSDSFVKKKYNIKTDGSIDDATSLNRYQQTPSSVVRKIDRTSIDDNNMDDTIAESHSQNEVMDLHQNKMKNTAKTTPSANTRRVSDVYKYR